MSSCRKFRCGGEGDTLPVESKVMHAKTCFLWRPISWSVCKCLQISKGSKQNAKTAFANHSRNCPSILRSQHWPSHKKIRDTVISNTHTKQRARWCKMFRINLSKWHTEDWEDICCRGLCWRPRHCNLQDLKPPGFTAQQLNKFTKGVITHSWKRKNKNWSWIQMEQQETVLNTAVQLNTVVTNQNIQKLQKELIDRTRCCDVQHLSHCFRHTTCSQQALTWVQLRILLKKAVAFFCG